MRPHGHELGRYRLVQADDPYGLLLLSRVFRVQADAAGLFGLELIWRPGVKDDECFFLEELN